MIAYSSLPAVKSWCLHTIAPPLGAMVFCILGAFLVYKGFYDGAAPAVSAIQPAAGETRQEAALPVLQPHPSIDTTPVVWPAPLPPAR